MGPNLRIRIPKFDHNENNILQCTKYRVIHELWTELQYMISDVLVIKNVPISECPIFNNYTATTSCSLDQKVKIIEKIWDKIINKHITR
jgi:hypothetical protein